MLRFLKIARAWRASGKNTIFTSHPSSSSSSSALPSNSFFRRSYHGPAPQHHVSAGTLETARLGWASEPPGFSSILPSIFGGIFGVGLLEFCYADAGEGDHEGRPASESTLDTDAMEKLVRQERLRLDELLVSRGMEPGSYPRFTVAFKGQQVTVKFQIPSSCEATRLIADLVSHLGLKDGSGSGSRMILRAWDSTVAWQLTLNPPEKGEEISGENVLSKDKGQQEENVCVCMFESLLNPDTCLIEFMKKGSFSSKELDAMVIALSIAGRRANARKPLERKPRGYTYNGNKQNNAQIPSIEKSISALEAMGVRIYGVDQPPAAQTIGVISWDNIAGYDHQKREIEDTILLALHSPEVYDEIARGTRCKFETNRPRAVLFEGPPGTGKTSCARVIANQAGVPLLYVPLEVVMSKYYGESERLLGTVFSLANELPNGAIVFLDEVDSFAAARDREMHEATRRILSVLLRQIDGFEQEKRVVVIAATNRKQDLDPALISRFDSMIPFGLPDQRNREVIAAQYAKHLKNTELVQFAAVTDGMSGRDIRDVCQQAERKWASKLIRGQAPKDTEEAHLPPLEEYIKCAEIRRRALSDASGNMNQNSISILKKDPYAFV